MRDCTYKPQPIYIAHRILQEEAFTVFRLPPHKGKAIPITGHEGP
jgi:hypothetical protein